MRFFIARSLALATLVPALALLVWVPGCAKQSVGERCGDTSGPSGNDDCDDGLTCTKVGPNPGDNRCCYSDGHVTDSRCEISTTIPSAGSGGGGGASGASTAGTDSGGASPAGGGTG